MAEVSAHVSPVEVLDTEASVGQHCGGLVVLRWYPGRDGRGWLGGLQFVENALRCALLLKTSGSRP